MRSLLIIGAGGHGKVVADTAYLTGRWSKISFLDDRFPLDCDSLFPVIAKIKDAPSLLSKYEDIIVAIGNNHIRVNLMQRFKKMGFNIPIIIHPKAFVSDLADLREGTVVFAQAAINAGAKIGFGCIVNTGSTVDHDCYIGQGVHLSPGVNIAGGVTIRDYSWLGIGSSVIQQIDIGENVIVGAGSVVIHDIESNATVVGVPARVIKINKELLSNG